MCRKGTGNPSTKDRFVQRLNRKACLCLFHYSKKRLVENWQWGPVDLAVVGNEPSLAWQITADCSPDSLASQICSTATSSLAPTQFLQVCIPTPTCPTIWKTSVMTHLHDCDRNESGVSVAKPTNTVLHTGVQSRLTTHDRSNRNHLIY